MLQLKQQDIQFKFKNKDLSVKLLVLEYFPFYNYQKNFFKLWITITYNYLLPLISNVCKFGEALKVTGSEVTETEDTS